jgi:acyl carrier protein
MATVFERLKKVIVEQLDVDEEQITPSASFVDDFNADSLDFVELITAIEEEFGAGKKKLEISDEDASTLETVQDAINYLHNHGMEDN